MNCKEPDVASYKGCPYYKSQAFRQHVVSSQKSYGSILKSSPPQNVPSMSFSAEKLIKFVTTVVVKVAQPQLCYSNPSKGTIEKKSNVCKEISEVAQKILGVDIKGETLFKAIPSVGQEWIGYTRTHIPMFVPKLGLIKPGQAYVCPQLWAFCIEILLWLILYFWETGHQLCFSV